MDRFRKRLEEFRLKVRKIVKYNWYNEPEDDVFRSLNIIHTFGAVRYKPTHKWQRICWNALRFVSVFSFLTIIFNFVDAIHDKFDLVKITWHATIALAATLCLLKGAIINQHYESIQTAQNFINSKPFGSGDTLDDSSCRMKFFQRLQLLIFVFFMEVLVDQIIFIFPNSGINELFGTPRILQQLGPALAGGIHFVFVFTICPIWINKYFAGTGTVCSLLYGFTTEYEIFVRGFENILDNVYLDVEEKLPSSMKAAPNWKHYKRDQLFWKCLKQRVNCQVQLHVELVEYGTQHQRHSCISVTKNMRSLQPIVKYLFGIIYYNAMVTFSPLMYVAMFSRLSVTSIFLVSAVALNLLECYGWCYIVESHQDINESLEDVIMDLMTKIPHSQLHHKEYLEMRTTLCIMKTFVRNNEPYSCGGVFPITVEAFTELLNIGYTVVTFLMDVGKQDWKKSFSLNK